MTQINEILKRFPELNAISDERKRAIQLMLTCGWTLDFIQMRSQRHYVFRRPDTGGLVDVMTITHDRLKPLAVAHQLIPYEHDLSLMVNDLLMRWVVIKETANGT